MADYNSNLQPTAAANGNSRSTRRPFRVNLNRVEPATSPTVSAVPPRAKSMQIISGATGPALEAIRDLDRLLKREFGKASELARMQTLGFLVFEPLERLQADLQVLADALPVEFAGHARELDFTVKRLIRDA
jgi:hypothetical protein